MNDSPEIVVRFEQLVYTWHSSTLHGMPGHGVVLRTPGWPGKLALPRGELFELTAAVPEDGGGVFVLRHGKGTVFGCRTPLGLDASGRPGNYIVHVLYDPTGEVGALDVLMLAAAGWFVSGLAPDVTATDAWEPVEFSPRPAWPSRVRAVAEPYTDGRIVAGRALDVVDIYAALLAAAPGRIANGWSLTTDPSLAGDYDSRGEAPNLPGEFGRIIADAVAAGVPGSWDPWRSRSTWTIDQWATKLRLQTWQRSDPATLEVGELAAVVRARGQTPEASDELVRRLVSDPLVAQDPTVADLLRSRTAGQVSVVERLWQSDAPAASSVLALTATDKDFAEWLRLGHLGPLVSLPEGVVGRVIADGLDLDDAEWRELIGNPAVWPALQRMRSPQFEKDLALSLILEGSRACPVWFRPVVTQTAAQQIEPIVARLGLVETGENLTALVGSASAHRLLLRARGTAAVAYVLNLARGSDDHRLPLEVSRAFSAASTNKNVLWRRLTLVPRARLRRQQASLMLLGFLMGVLAMLIAWWVRG